MNTSMGITARLGASHQPGWTGLVAKLIQLFGMLDAKKLLEAGKAGVFVRGEPAEVGAGTAREPGWPKPSLKATRGSRG
jgi:hypothetical protein